RQWSRDVGMPDAIADVLVLCVEAHERAIDPGAGIVTDAEERSGQTLSDEQLHQLSLSAHAEVQFQMQARGIRLVEERLPSERVKSLKGLIVREVRRR